MLIKDGSELNGKVSKVLLTGSTVSHYIHVHLNITIVVHTQTKTTQKHTEKLHKIPVFSIPQLNHRTTSTSRDLRTTELEKTTKTSKDNWILLHLTRTSTGLRQVRRSRG